MPVKNPTMPDRQIDPERRRELVHHSAGADAPDGRPARGLAPEDALERWSDRAAYDSMLEYWDARNQVSMPPGREPTEVVRRHQEFRRLRDPLVAAFHARLASGALMASAVRTDGDPLAGRRLVDPELFDEAQMEFGDATLRGRYRPLHLGRLEIFEPSHLPLNVREVPDWYRKYDRSRELPSGAGAVAGFVASGLSHWDGYRIVEIGGHRFRQTAMQAKVVKKLHEASLTGNPWVHYGKLLEAAGSTSTKFSHLFRRVRDPHWSLMIESDGRGYWRLRLPPAD